MRAAAQAEVQPPDCLIASVASQPVAGGDLYTYVVDPVGALVMVFQNGVPMATYKVGEGGPLARYSLEVARVEPAGGGQTYCFAVDHGGRTVHVLQGVQYVGAHSLAEATPTPP